MGDRVQFRGHLPVAAFVGPLAGAAGQCGSACHPGWRALWCRYRPFTVGLQQARQTGKIAARISLWQRTLLWLQRDMSSRHEMEGIKGKGGQVNSTGALAGKD
jgi:hypothetical protein